MKSVLAIFFVLGWLLPISAQAETPRQLEWDDLVPSGAPIDDPLLELTTNQGFELETIASIRARRELGMISDVADEAEWGGELEARLKKQGLDIEALLQRYMKMQMAIKERNGQVVEALDGALIRMPGYVLPLEFEGQSVEEFLLVPYVGACIHVPPPPRNQMVFVRLNQSFAMKDLYEPVWITGRMKTRGVNKSMNVVDGTIDVSAGYVIEGTRIEPYEE